MSREEVELFQFPYSHFNEKARWALDWKGVEHSRTNLLPGPHTAVVTRLTGQPRVPVVRFDAEAVPGSAAIIHALEQRYPEPPLYPGDANELAEALALQAHFDAEVGPLVRRAHFAVLLKHPGYICRLFVGHRNTPVRTLYRAGFPLIARVMAQSTGAGDAEAAKAAAVATEAALDLVAERSKATGYLVGDAFSVADLCAASLLAPIANPNASPMHHPLPQPPSIADWLARWDAHPGVAWVRSIYTNHRSPEGATLTHSAGGIAPPGRAARPAP